jgi:hypothetical protein
LDCGFLIEGTGLRVQIIQNPQSKIQNLKLTTTQGDAFGSAPGYYAKPFQGVLFFSDH